MLEEERDSKILHLTHKLFLSPSGRPDMGQRPTFLLHLVNIRVVNICLTHASLQKKNCPRVDKDFKHRRYENTYFLVSLFILKASEMHA